MEPRPLPCLYDLQESLHNSIKICYPKPSHMVCIFTDASDHFRARMVRQTPEIMYAKDIHHQVHDPWHFFGGTFVDSQQHWTSYETEAYAILSASKRLDYLLLGPPSVRVYTIHRNLLYVFFPLALRLHSLRHVISKAHYCGIHLPGFDFSKAQISGNQNVCAEKLIRWVRGLWKQDALTRKVGKFYCSMVPSCTKTAVPELEKVKRLQKIKSLAQGWRYQVMHCILHNSHELKIKILNWTHWEVRGQRGCRVTDLNVEERFWWNGLKEDMNKFFRDGLIVVFRTEERTLRPLSAVHGYCPNRWCTWIISTWTWWTKLPPLRFVPRRRFQWIRVAASQLLWRQRRCNGLFDKMHIIIWVYGLVDVRPRVPVYFVSDRNPDLWGSYTTYFHNGLWSVDQQVRKTIMLRRATILQSLIVRIEAWPLTVALDHQLCPNYNQPVSSTNAERVTWWPSRPVDSNGILHRFKTNSINR